MHVTVSPDLWINYHNVIFEGGLYEIINVRAGQANGFCRPVSTSKCIRFVHSTIISPCLYDDFIIPMHKFELKPLGDLYEIVRSYEPYQKPIYSTGDSNFIS